MILLLYVNSQILILMILSQGVKEKHLSNCQSSMVLKERASVQVMESHHWFEIVFCFVHVEAGCESIQVFFSRLENPLGPDIFMTKR